MTGEATRRSFLGAAMVAGVAALGACGGSSGAPSRSSTAAPTPSVKAPSGVVPAALAEVERRFGRRIGVVAVDVATARRVEHRADERFLLCSTGKVLTVAAVLAAAGRDARLLTRCVTYDSASLVAHSPVTSTHVAGGMTVEQLCSAALTVSDNTAENLLLGVVGGPPAVTTYVRTLGDRVSRLDRPETSLNDRTAAGLDTTTPTSMVADLRTILLGSALEPAARARLTGWMRGCTTGYRQIRAGAPSGWVVADKTGSGTHAESNDVGVLWRPDRTAVVLAVYTDGTDPTSTTGPAAIAAATRAVLAALG